MKWLDSIIRDFVEGITAACLVFGIRTSEEPKYKVLRKENNIEIREYSAVLVAEIHLKGNYDATVVPAFRKLAAFILGKNRKQKSHDVAISFIKQKEENELIAMTAPVIQQKYSKGWTMQFTMPAKYTRENLPLPNDADIIIKTVSPRKVAVLRYSGILNEERIETKITELKHWIETNGLFQLGVEQSAGYDPPWTIPFFRRNEILIEIM